MTVGTNEWLRPIRADAPGGDDVSFSETFDKIREARRADDPGLSQGDWQHELKVANWRIVIELAGRVLSEQSKDLQAAVWLGEALIAQAHLGGAHAAFELLAQLQDHFWDELHPRIEDGDLDERSAKLAWFNEYGAQALLALRVSPGTGGYTLADWQVSRDVDNLARQDASAHEEALAEGKPTAEMFDRAVEGTADAQLLEQLQQATQAAAALQQLKQVTDARMGRDAPSLARLEDALKRLQQILTRAANIKGLLVAGDGAAETAPSADGETEGGYAAPAAGAAAGGGAALRLGGGDPASKAAAVKALGEIAAWFRRAEPHSPVSYLLDRAVAWADTPLEQWLAEVVNDENTLSRVRERIGLPG